MQVNDEINERQIKDAPWCWQHKEVLTMLTETLGESDQQASARSLYVALSELASDNGSETFTAAKALIAHKAGLSVSTVQRLLKSFEQLGVVRIKRGLINGLIKTANTYTLLSLGHDLSIGHGDPSIGIGRQRRSNPDKVKESKNNKKNNDEKRARETAAATKDASSSSISVSNLEEAEKHPYWKQFKRFCESRGGSPNPKGFNTWLKSQPPPKAKSKSSPASPKKSSNGAKPLPEICDEKHAAIIAKFKADNRAAGLVVEKPEQPF